MAERRLRELYPVFDEALEYMIDLLDSGEIDRPEFERQLIANGYSDFDISRALAYLGVIQ